MSMDTFFLRMRAYVRPLYMLTRCTMVLGIWVMTNTLPVTIYLRHCSRKSNLDPSKHALPYDNYVELHRCVSPLWLFRIRQVAPLL